MPLLEIHKRELITFEQQLNNEKPKSSLYWTEDYPDTWGPHNTPWGDITLDYSGINPKEIWQHLYLYGALGNVSGGSHGRRIDLSSEGTGGSMLSERHILTVALHSPIRIKGEWKRVMDAGYQYWVRKDAQG